jgi:hypothetical protein
MTPQLNVSASDQIRPVVILGDLSNPDIGATIKFDTSLVSWLLRKLGSRAAAPQIVDVNTKDVKKAISNLDVDRTDTLLCFYSGGLHKTDDDREIVLKFSPDYSYGYHDLIAALKEKKARFTVVIVDILAYENVFPSTDELLVIGAKGSDVDSFAQMLLDGKGFTVLDSFFGQNDIFPVHYQERTSSGTGSLGSVFMREFLRECTLGVSATKSNLSWTEFERELIKNIRLSYRVSASVTVKQGFEKIESGDYAEALEVASLAFRLDPGFADAHALQGSAYLRKREYKRAVESFGRAIAEVSDYAYARHGRAVTKATTARIACSGRSDACARMATASARARAIAPYWAIWHN